MVTAESNGKTIKDSCVWVLEGFGTQQFAKIYDLLKYIPHILIHRIVNSNLVVV